tara:strand:- start:148 stop:465 length:318 start_codon:yes stop_codon:yes gene_type:complete
MKYIMVIILILSCSPMFISDQKMNEIWIGENYNDVIDILGPYNKKIEDLSKQGHNILIWEASKSNILIPIEKLGSRKNKLGTSVSSLHIYIDENGKIKKIKKSLY